MLSEAVALEHYRHKHLAAAVGDALAVLLPNLVGREVCGDEGDKLAGVAVFQEVGDGRRHPAIVHLLARLSAEVVNAEEVVVAKNVETVLKLPGAVYVFRRHDAQSRAIVEHAPIDEPVDGALHSLHKRRLAVAHVAHDDGAEAAALACEHLSHLHGSLTQLVVGLRLAASERHLAGIAVGYQVADFLSWIVYPKTPSHTLQRRRVSRQYLVGGQLLVLSYNFHCLMMI